MEDVKCEKDVKYEKGAKCESDVECEEDANREKSVKQKKDMGPALSLLALLARSSIYKLIAVFAVMALTEIALYYGCLKLERGYTLKGTMESSHISAVFLAAMGLVFLILARTEGLMDEKSRGTMLRLRLSGREIFVIKTLYNVFCLVLLFILQIWLAIWMVRFYGEVMTDIYASPQRLFLAFYRIDFLHCLLPMAETGKWMRNLLFLLAFGMEAAGGWTGKTEMKNYIPMLLLYFLTVNCFVGSVGMNLTDIICIGVYAVMIGTNVWKILKTDDNVSGHGR